MSAASALAALLVLLLIAYAIAVAGLKRQGIELAWHGLGWASAGPTVDYLAIRQTNAGGEWFIELESLRVGWQTAWLPDDVQVADARIAWTPSAKDSVPDTPAELDIAQLPPLPQWLPEHVNIRHFTAALPCPMGRCQLNGNIQTTHDGAGGPLEVHIQLERAAHTAALDLELTRSLDRVGVVGDLVLDGVTRGRVDTAFELDPMRQRWTGLLDISELREAPWLWEWAKEWLTLPDDRLPPQDMTLAANWRLDLPPGPIDVQRLMAANGSAAVRLTVPTPWPVPGVGSLYGRLDTEWSAADGLWLPRRLDADLLLDEPQGDWLKGIPSGMRPSRLGFSARPLPTAAATAPGVLPVKVDVQVYGPTELRVQGDAQVDTANRSLALDNTRLTAKAASIQWGDVTVLGLDMQLAMDAKLDPDRFTATLNKGSRVQTRELGTADASGGLTLERLDLTATPIHVATGFDTGGGLGALTFNGNVSVRTERFVQSALKPQGWRWQGTVQGDLDRQRLQGTLTGDSGIGIQTDITNRAGQGQSIVLQGNELFFRAGNPIRESLAAWPETLTLGNGRLRWNGNLTLAPGRPLTATLVADGSGIAGIYDRFEFEGMDVKATVSIENDRLSITLPAAQVRELNPGLPIGPLHLAGGYAASLDAPTQGSLHWQRAHLRFAQGQFELAPDQWDLARNTGRTHVRMVGLDLAELLRLYPTEGLTGSGTLDGEMPVRFAGKGPIIENGKVTARSLGGVLSFRSERIRALGSTNPGMKLVADALQDFRYRALNSGVDYAEDGTLQLSLRLEGSNPAIEKGRQINFNINLEEDIPALLTSLQLTDRVSETIQRRVQESLQRRNKPAAPATEVTP
ncbi:YdbH domain-containing protein [Pseudomonas matsuisoli]|uniref:Dicarboxylate transport n=1 Tax=Pseudomonas matsuisoli TaxID=1515666 RepID=A0A917PH81_9PSED|nr:YdbH domain-containing protein [Pseudomonas matsuisoli]GGJ78645.1 hypothetical protein GCM10009304_00690 [Pseudomonas matsuisoli]